MTIQTVYPGVMVNVSCKAEGFSIISYSWFMIASGANSEMVIVNETDATYTITDPVYTLNGTDYYCVAINDEGIAVSNRSTVIGNA